MLVYIPYYGPRGWQVAEVNTAVSKYRKTPGYPATVTNYGTIYNGEHMFTQHEGARLWIMKEDSLARRYEYILTPSDWEVCKQ